jgi:hypothetical protein
MKPIRPTVLLCLGLCLGAGSTGSARADEGSAAIPLSVEAYAQALTQGKDVPVDTLFTLGMRAANDLAGPDGVMSDLTDPDYDAVVKRMQGFHLSRNEVELAEPDPSFFLERARAQADSVGILFFQDYQETVPEGSLPAWFRPMTDYSGCVEFGSLALVHAYGRWKAFALGHPHRYAAQVAGFRRKIETILTVGDCACEDKESVLKELNAFLESFPRATIADRVRQRVQAIQEDRAHIRYHCAPS